MRKIAVAHIISLILGWTLTAHAQGETIQWRAALGGEINEDPHLVLDLGVRQGTFSLQLYTDTLDLRWSPCGEAFCAWVSARAEGGAAGLLISPWRDGAPSPEEALIASYLGGNAGFVVYLPWGFYTGLSGEARLYHFAALSETIIPIPGPRFVLSPDATLGLWGYDGALQADVRVGIDVQSSRQSPRAAGFVRIAPRWTLGPLIEVRAGSARNQDFLTLTRLGGLNPYVVPVAGAAWAEFRVQSYAAARVGPRLSGAYGHLALVADLARFDDKDALGIGLLGRLQHGDMYLDSAVGFAPTLERSGSFPALSLWLVGGLDWMDW